MSNPVNRKRKRKYQKENKNETLQNILKKMEGLDNFMDGSADMIFEIKKDLNEMKKAMTIFNAIVDVLINKGVITHDEVKEVLRNKSGVKIFENDELQLEESESDSESVVRLGDELPVASSERSDNSKKHEDGN